ncbi:MAG: PHB depolymerase family esterase [bacterium]|nr:PHB depolymerase family esterase [bacterium]
MRFWILVTLLSGFLIVNTADVSAQDVIEFEERTLTHDGRERLFLLYVPPQYDGITPMPLVFMLHGGGGNPYAYEEMTGFAQKAQDEGFILVYPAGTGRFRNMLTWNAGYCCGYAFEQDVDDVGFFSAMIETLTGEYIIDPARIYVAGHSNGGMMAYRLGAELSDIFAGVGIMAGTIGGYATPESDQLYIIPEPENPVSVIHIHGMADENVRYDGGVNDKSAISRRNDLSVADAMVFWVAVNQCDPTPSTELRDGDMVQVDIYACDATGTGVTLISIVDGGHSWAGGEVLRRRGDQPSQRVSATDEIWAFFEEHPKP